MLHSDPQHFIGAWVHVASLNNEKQMWKRHCDFTINDCRRWSLIVKSHVFFEKKHTRFITLPTRTQFIGMKSVIVSSATLFNHISRHVNEMSAEVTAVIVWEAQTFIKHCEKKLEKTQICTNIVLAPLRVKKCGAIIFLKNLKFVVIFCYSTCSKTI